MLNAVQCKCKTHLQIEDNQGKFVAIEDRAVTTAVSDKNDASAQKKVQMLYTVRNHLQTIRDAEAAKSVLISNITCK